MRERRREREREKREGGREREEESALTAGCPGKRGPGGRRRRPSPGLAAKCRGRTGRRWHSQLWAAALRREGGGEKRRRTGPRLPATRQAKTALPFPERGAIDARDVQVLMVAKKQAATRVSSRHSAACFFCVIVCGLAAEQAHVLHFVPASSRPQGRNPSPLRDLTRSSRYH